MLEGNEKVTKAYSTRVRFSRLLGKKRTQGEYTDNYYQAVAKRTPVALASPPCFTALEHYRIIERTKQGGRNAATLYAFTWRRIDWKKDKPLDVSPTAKPSDCWKTERPDYVRSTGKRKQAAAKTELVQRPMLQREEVKAA